MSAGEETVPVELSRERMRLLLAGQAMAVTLAQQAVALGLPGTFYAALERLFEDGVKWERLTRGSKSPALADLLLVEAAKALVADVEAGR